MSHHYPEAIKELYRAHAFFLEHFKVEEKVAKVQPVITIASVGRKKALGWFWGDTWTVDGTPTHEINISAEAMNRPVRDIMRTLLHEMAHLHNFVLGITDCNAVQYHNKHFKTRAEAYGQIVDKMPGKGYALTTLSHEGEAAIDLLKPDESVFKAARVRKSSVAKENPYISIVLKKEDYELLLDELKEKLSVESYADVVKHLINNAKV